MPDMPSTFRPKHLGTMAQGQRQYERARGSRIERGYDAKWRKASASSLRASPFCAYCELNEGRATAATCTDHLYPQRTYPGVFWEAKWWVSSCDSCHSGFKQGVEARGKSAIDALAARLGREVMP